ncbi:MAG: hypothetical protein RR230_00505 [Oscillospiraceae bacterium]
MNRPSFRFKLPSLGSKKEAIETGKTLLIILLLISALLLCAATGVFESIGGVGGAFVDKVVGGAQESGGYTAAAVPFYVVVTPGKSAHCAVLYDDEATAAAYERFSPSLGEALGSSLRPKKVAQEEWEAALAGEGVYFDYINDQLMSVLAGWLGTSVSGEAGLHTARRICLSKSGDGVALYYYRVRADSGPYRCETKLNWTDISARVGEYLPNGARYNFELEESFPSVDDCAIIMPTQPRVPSVTALDSLQTSAQSSTLLAAFGMNDVLATSYREGDGALVWVEGDATLRLSAGGTVVYGGAGEHGQALSPAEAVERVRALCASTIGKYCGEASIYLSSISHSNETDTYTMCFDYSVNGLPVMLPSGSAAEITVTGQAVTAATMRFRSYSSADIPEKPLPSLQAAAVVEAKGGGEPMLCYMDNADGVTASWVRK